MITCACPTCQAAKRVYLAPWHERTRAATYRGKAAGSQEGARRREARAWEPRVYRTVHKVLATQYDQAAQRVGQGLGVDDLLQVWANSLFDAAHPMVYTMVYRGVQLTAKEFEAAKALAPPPGVEVGEWEAFLQTHDFTGVEEHLRAVSERGAATTQGKVQRIFRKAGEEYWTTGDIAKALRAAKVVDSRWRANLWAHTETAWSYNRGQHLQHIAQGVPAERWHTQGDASVCLYCGQMEDVTVRTADAFFEAGDGLTVEADGREQTYTATFAVEHPPLHPNCHCHIEAVFV